MISSGLMRSEWPNTCGATTWPSSCWSARNSSATQTALSGSSNSATRIGGIAPSTGPMYGMSSISPKKAPKNSA